MIILKQNCLKNAMGQDILDTLYFDILVINEKSHFFFFFLVLAGASDITLSPHTSPVLRSQFISNSPWTWEQEVLKAHFQENSSPEDSWGRGVITLTCYMCMCLSFGVLFREIWYSDRWVFIRDEGAQIQKLGIFWANYGKKHPIWAKLDAFLSKRYTDGWVIGWKIGIEKVKFSRFGRHIHVRFCRK